MRPLGYFLFGGLMIYSLFCVWTARKAVQFRKHPVKSTWHSWSSAWPHDLIARKILLTQPSTLLYQATILEELFLPHSLIEYGGCREKHFFVWPFEKKMYVKFVLESDTSVQQSLLRALPSQGTKVLVPRFSELLRAREYGAICHLAGSREGVESVNDWYAALPNSSEYREGSRLEGFIGAWPYFTSSGNESIVPAFASASTSEPWRLASRLSESTAGPDKDGRVRRVLTWLIEQETDSAIGNYGRSERKKDAGEYALHLTPFFGMISKGLAHPGSQKSALAFMEREMLYGGGDRSDLLIDADDKKCAAPLSSLKSIFPGAYAQAPKAALALLRGVAHCDRGVADEWAHSILTGKDNSNEKAVIVTLANAKTDLGKSLVDDAFRGSAPREIEFRNTRMFLSSDAVRKYTLAVGHDYEATGKSWPPLLAGPLTCPERATMLESLIKEFPWFPGVDDAVYVVMYCAVTTGDTTRGLQALEDYLQRDVLPPDADAGPYFGQIVKSLYELSSIDSSRYRFAFDLGKAYSFNMIRFALGWQTDTDASTFMNLTAKPEIVRILDRSQKWLPNFRTTLSAVLEAPIDMRAQVWCNKARRSKFYGTTDSYGASMDEPRTATDLQQNTKIEDGMRLIGQRAASNGTLSESEIIVSIMLMNPDSPLSGTGESNILPGRMRVEFTPGFRELTTRIAPFLHNISCSDSGSSGRYHE